MKRITYLIFFLLANLSFSQNTVGTISVKNEVMEGYTLFNSYNFTYLINNCGQVINKWTSAFPPGNSAYLLPNGNLLRTGADDGKSLCAICSCSNTFLMIIN